MAATEDRAPSTKSSSDEEIPDETPESPRFQMIVAPKLPPATEMVVASPTVNKLPLAVCLLSDPGMLLKVMDASSIVPRLFATYEGPGGERVRALYHSMLAEYKANAEDGFIAHGSVKCALFVAFIDLCCAFIPAATEEACSIVIETSLAFLGSVRALLKSEVHEVIKDYIRTEKRVPITDQVKLMERYFHVHFDTRQIIVGDSPLVLPARRAHSDLDTRNMFAILHEHASSRDTSFFRHAQNVRDQVQRATSEKHMYVAHIFLRYFIYTLAAVSRLASADWQKITEVTHAESREDAEQYFKCKIDSRLRSNFDDLRSYMMSSQFAINDNVTAEYQLYADHSTPRPRAPAPPSSSSSSASVRNDRSFRPEMTIPDDTPQQGGSCATM